MTKARQRPRAQALRIGGESAERVFALLGGLLLLVLLRFITGS